SFARPDSRGRLSPHFSFFQAPFSCSSRISSSFIYFQLQNSFVGVACGYQGGQKVGDVVGTARLHGDVDGRVAKIHSVVGAVVGGFNDVGAMVGQNSREAVERAGIVGQVNAQANEASVFHQAAFDDAR